MPMFDYKCANCDHTFEELVYSSGEEPKVCPICNAEAPEKLMSAPAPLAGSAAPTSPEACPCGEKQGTGFS
ncbi:MAG: zinc ribbon domain-containing protein [Candidatus Marinimicrobia bacterium]|jgi:putative FmdB family regulatory protein|nr:zinc ribbon domain-containing protein [Candidatus Neomarinimicrobiota bacterium]